jgi:hypothetical protein
MVAVKAAENSLFWPLVGHELSSPVGSILLPSIVRKYIPREPKGLFSSWCEQCESNVGGPPSGKPMRGNSGHYLIVGL